ncbi:MAG TPA: heme o synthase [Candidatus Limnocylindria bacterium]|nr:heme o synthase [Candidatus Limnocylindria bacterium]
MPRGRSPGGTHDLTFSPAYRRLVYLTLLAALPAAFWGGIVRVTGSGLGCPDWPLCHGQFLPSLDVATRIEWFHRFLAIVAGLTLAGLAVWTLMRYRMDRRAVAFVGLAVVLYWLQAILGAITVLLELPDTWVTVHLANAELLLAVLSVYAVVARWPAAGPGLARPSAFTWLALSAAAGTFILMLSGAYVRGDGATAACSTWPLCNGGIPISGTAAIHMAHRYVAAAVGVIVAFAVVGAWQRRHLIPGLGVAAALTGSLFTLQVVIGALNPLSGFSPWSLGAHPAVATALWCATVALAVLAWRPVRAEATTTLRDLVALTKPAIMSLLLVTALGGMFLAAGGVPPFHLVLATMLGGAFASGGASALNHYFDRDIDARMRRTSRRPLPGHRVSGRVAIAVGLILNVLAFALLALVANVLAATLAIVGTLFYILVYTLWLKRTTVQNIVIGGAAGAIPPLVGWAAVANNVDLPALYLFAIVFFWTPAHFWALALLIRDDYDRAGVPMLPVVHGDRAAQWGILLYATALVPLSVLLFLTRSVGLVYLFAALVLGIVFVGFAVRLLRSAAAKQRSVARSVYLYSLLYLALLFVAIMVDTTVRL